jgi:hypothetical protein
MNGYNTFYVPELFKNLLLSQRGNIKTHLLACNCTKYWDKALLFRLVIISEVIIKYFLAFLSYRLLQCSRLEIARNFHQYQITSQSRARTSSESACNVILLNVPRQWSFCNTRSYKIESHMRNLLFLILWNIWLWYLVDRVPRYRLNTSVITDIPWMINCLLLLFLWSAQSSKHPLMF